jgi:hypothetical protein
MKNQLFLKVEHGIAQVPFGFQGTLRLPEVLTKSDVEALLAAGPDEPYFLAKLFDSVPWSDRLRFKQAAIDFGLSREWATLAVNWASIFNQSCKWNLDEFTPVFSYVVNSWWLDQIIVTSTDHRFAISDGLVMTFTEFYHRYGTTVHSHLYEYADNHANEIRTVADQIQGKLVSRRISFANKDGQIDSGVFSGLSTVPVDQWLVPAGVVLLDTGELVTTVPPTKEDHS